MKGCRPLTDDEVTAVTAALQSDRDRALWLLGIRSGFRISELLSLKMADVVQHGRITDRVTVQRRHMKGQKEGRSVMLHIEAKGAIERLIASEGLWHEAYLFRSGRFHNRPLGYLRAWQILKAAYAIVGITGKAATHTMRKTFAKRVYQAADENIFKTQKALGHKNLNNTVSYLNVGQDEIDALIIGLK